MVIRSHCYFDQSTSCCLSIETSLFPTLSFSFRWVPVIYTYWPGIYNPFSCNIMCDVVCDVVCDARRLTESVLIICTWR